MAQKLHILTVTHCESASNATTYRCADNKDCETDEEPYGSSSRSEEMIWIFNGLFPVCVVCPRAWDLNSTHFQIAVSLSDF